MCLSGIASVFSRMMTSDVTTSVLPGGRTHNNFVCIPQFQYWDQLKAGCFLNERYAEYSTCWNKLVYFINNNLVGTLGFPRWGLIPWSIQCHLQYLKTECTETMIQSMRAWHQTALVTIFLNVIFFKIDFSWEQGIQSLQRQPRNQIKASFWFISIWMLLLRKTGWV